MHTARNQKSNASNWSCESLCPSDVSSLRHHLCWTTNLSVKLSKILSPAVAPITNSVKATKASKLLQPFHCWVSPIFHSALYPHTPHQLYFLACLYLSPVSWSLLCPLCFQWSDSTYSPFHDIAVTCLPPSLHPTPFPHQYPILLPNQDDSFTIFQNCIQVALQSASDLKQKKQ